jgi:type VII secretion integral membrane protein EccD
LGAATDRAPRPLCTVLSAGAVVGAAVTGALAAAASAPAVLLASGAALLMSVALGNLRIGAASAMSGCAATAGATAASTGLGMVAAPGVGATGALLTVVSLLLLSAAPTLTVAMAGLGPGRATVSARRAQTAQRVLTGLVAGWAGTAVAGAVLVAADAQVSRLLAAAFCGVLAALLLLRQRVHADPRRRTVLCATGFAALLVALWVTVTAAPQWAPWWCAVVAAAAAAGLAAWLRGSPPNPMWRWAVHVAEYASLAAVVPLAGWVAGVYDTVRGMNLP